MKRLHTMMLRLLLVVMFVTISVTSQAQFCLLFDTGYDVPNTLINDVVEDRNSMIWIGTEDGLYRYDGSKFTSYKKVADNVHSLQENNVRCLFVDNAGHLLVGSRAGLQVYRPDTDDFSELATFADGAPSRGDVANIIQRSNGEIWMTGNATLCLRIESDGTPVLYENSFTAKVDMTESITEDMFGRIWVTKSVEDMFRLETNGEVVEVKYQQPGYFFSTLFMAVDGNLYAGGQQNGLFRYDRISDTFKPLGTSADASYQVRDMCNYSRDEMLVGTDNKGLLIYNFKTETFRPYLFDNGRIDPLTQKVHAICLDSENSIWLGLYQKGLMFIPNRQQAFNYLGYNSYHYNCIGDKCVTSIKQSGQNAFWIATDNGGMYEVTREGQRLRHIANTGMPGSLPSSLICIFPDKKGRLWYGSYTQGFGLLDVKTGKCMPCSVEGKSEPNSSVFDFEEDQDGRIWAASLGKGLYVYDEARKTMITAVDTSFCKWTNDLLYDPARNCLYAASHNGLAIIDLEKPGFSAENHLFNFIVYGVTLYDVNSLCLSTNHGLLLYDFTTREYVQYDETCGLPSNMVYTSQVDDKGMIWVGGNSGLSCIDPKTGTVSAFSSNDGIQSSEFYKNATLKDDQGNLWFGGVAGITWFNPDRISLEGKAFAVRITDFVVSGRSYHSDYNLEHADNSPTIEIGTLPIMDTRKASYKYSLDRDKWITLPAGQNHVTFSHLPAGTHRFEFYGVMDGVESAVESLTFVIADPWYRTWWAQLLWLAVFALIMWIVYAYLTNHLKARADQIEHEQKQAINEAKLQFFMNISHEIRTPMTLIVSPLQKLINTDKDPSHQHSYELIQRNANRILSLINQLMDLRKIDKNQMQMFFSEVEIVPYLNNIADTIRDVADIREINARLIDETRPGLKLWIDTDNFDKIIINLLSNSLKYTPKGGSIVVRLQEEPATEQMPDGVCVLTVTDTGIGIPETERQHIFDRFYQIRGNNINGGGTGIGLNLTHSLVTLHHGTIELKDNPEGRGTCFEIRLPLGNRHLKFEEMNHEMPIVTASKELPRELNIEQIATDIEPETASPASRKRVMVVEDDKEIRDYIISELRNSYVTVECQDGQQALDIIMQQAPDLIISDLMMPNMDGMTLCKKVRQNVRFNHLPIIILTAKTQDEDRIAGLEVGADAYITKPFNMELLSKTVQNLLSSHDRLRNTYSGQQLPTDQIDTPESKSPDERLLERVIKVVNQHLNDPALTTDFIAREVGLSRVHLYRKLKELTNQSARDYVRNIRLAKAAELLSQKKVAVAEVANLVGFSNPNNFATAFRELYGMTPTQYMEQHIS